MSDPDFVRAVEAVLFAAAEPLLPSDIAAHAGEGNVDAALASLRADYAARGRMDDGIVSAR